MTEEQENAAYNAQDEYITKNFPKGTKANQGWAVDEITETIATKVYGFGILETHVPTLTHTFTPRD